MLQKAGGAFALTAETDFGASFGLKALYIKSEESNIATTGILRLGNASAGIVWRNAAHNADLALTVNSSNQLTFNGTSIGATTSLTDGHILVGNGSNQPADVAMSGDITISDLGVTAIGAGKVLDANVGSAAAIALSKLAASTGYYWYAANVSGVLTPLAVTASRAVATDANGLPVAATTTATELGYVNGVTSAIQTQLAAKLPLAGGTMSGNLNMGSNKIVSLTQGANAGEAIAFPVGTAQITAGSITTALLAANAVTSHSQVTDGIAFTPIGTDITTLTITTSGGPVLLLASASIANDRVNYGVQTWLKRGTTYLPGSLTDHILTSASLNPIMQATALLLDSPTAGTYTYHWGYTTDFTQVITATEFSLTAIELKA